MQKKAGTGAVSGVRHIETGEKPMLPRNAQHI